jgi:group I intron endonuclease
MKSNRFNSTLTRGNSIILNALFKNGMDSFEFRILEFISSDNNDLRNKLLPEYNILKIAGSNRGHKLSTETRAKMSKAKKLHYSLKPSLRKGSKVSEQTRLLMSKNNKIAKKVFVYKSTDTSELGLLHIFDSITQACASLNYYPTRFIKYINTKLILDNKYIVS